MGTSVQCYKKPREGGEGDQEERSYAGNVFPSHIGCQWGLLSLEFYDTSRKGYL